MPGKHIQMSSEHVNKIRALILEMISRLKPLKPLMREEELEDVEYYESFDITDYTKKDIILSILDRLTNIEARLLKKNKTNFF